ncbi:TetR/AcrR family transcriptional regulator [Mycolicibacterium aubagnense]|uniref:Transcriptional regulator, TetR family protein n=1 Tax=Mycolicibacterium aubagnense TaxID=319707 RepID=A0ABM7IMF6_9MYCO|nr:helix-turn-helix domain-containing protein [Mycolicibacterium aubagnense]TLH48589.1 TetR/AcrR family transcriptional regulator [Mycolicibacterium aubagnense]BBX87996.1 putative transcriptional regulator, TetR family protein [Mycolicibacterium aubagnense]
MEGQGVFGFARPQRELSTEEKIVAAALQIFAERGIAVTSLRSVADFAGMSAGAVQHHFPTKASLVEAVDTHVLQIIADNLEPAVQEAEYTTVTAGKSIVQLIANHPIAMDYLKRVLVEGDAAGGVGQVIFDGLAKISESQGRRFQEQGLMRDDVDFLWSFLNPIILRVGAIILRQHIERFLPGHFYDREQLERWDSSITNLLQHGALIQPD